MRYDINSIGSSKSKEVAMKADQYLSLMPNVETVALGIKDFRTIIDSAQKIVNKKAKSVKSNPETVDSIFIRKHSRDIYFKAVEL